MLGDVEWVGASEGGDEVFAFSIRLDSRYNLGNEWEMIVGVVSAGADVRDGDGCWLIEAMKAPMPCVMIIGAEVSSN